MSEKENNVVYLKGKIVTDPVLTHRKYDEAFYEFDVSIERLSGTMDVLPITACEEDVLWAGLKKGMNIAAKGQFRSYNKNDNGVSRLMLSVFIQELLPEDAEIDSNNIVLNGFVVKPPVYRLTPFGREVADVFVAVNRGFNKSDYIPCIVWGENARFARHLTVGERVALAGRIQSRKYEKKLEDGVIERTAYEASISKIFTHNKEGKFDFTQDFNFKKYVG